MTGAFISVRTVKEINGRIKQKIIHLFLLISSINAIGGHSLNKGKEEKKGSGSLKDSAPA